MEALWSVFKQGKYMLVGSHFKDICAVYVILGFIKAIKGPIYVACYS